MFPLENTLDLFLMSYSKNRTVQEVLNCLTQAPKQYPNNKDCFANLIMEFRTTVDPRPGTLIELYDVFETNNFITHLDDGQIHIERDNERNFKVTKIFQRIKNEVSNLQN